MHTHTRACAQIYTQCISVYICFFLWHPSLRHFKWKTRNSGHLLITSAHAHARASNHASLHAPVLKYLPLHSISHLEIYKDQLLDLLNPGGTEKLVIQKDAAIGLYLRNLTCHVATNIEQAANILIKVT